MNDAKPRYRKAGRLRPTQVISQHGPGAIVDLPELSVVVAGLDEWRPTGMDRVSEPRLEAFVRATALFRPPTQGPGVPAYVFPEWLICPNSKCRMLAPKSDFHWNERFGEYLCPRAAIHGINAKVQAFPARFMTACPRGHLDDFPWDSWVHGGRSGSCNGPLRLDDAGRSGSVNDLSVKCEQCDAERGMGDVYGESAPKHCRGRRPWLGPSSFQEGCAEKPHVLLRGASNAYFAVVASALSIPPHSDPIQIAITPYLSVLQTLDNTEKIASAAELGVLGDLLSRYTTDEVLAAATGEIEEMSRLRPDEYEAFLNPPEPAQPPHEFEVRRVPLPEGGATSKIDEMRAATRLREVRALRGFTRIDSGIDIGDLADVAELNLNMAALGPSDIRWRPAVELRGEGIFLSLREQTLNSWEQSPRIVDRAAELSTKFREYQAGRSSDATKWQTFPGMRYVLLHSLAHVLIRRLCLDAGYSSSALRERIYSATGDNPMAGLLIYTASSDSEGSLGGLVDQGSTDRFGSVLLDALADARRCAQDPLCGTGELGGAAGLNGAACHACLLLAETSCEVGNRFLDRAVLVETLGQFARWFFDGA